MSAACCESVSFYIANELSFLLEYNSVIMTFIVVETKWKKMHKITLQSPRSEIIVLGDFNVHNSDWLSYSSNVSNHAGRGAEAFAKRLQTQHSRSSFINSCNTCYKTIKNAKSSLVQRINNKIASCQAGSRSCWSMAKVVSQNICQSSFPPLKNNSDSSSTSPSSMANLFASVFVSNSNLDDQEFQPHQFPPSKFTMSPIKFSTRKVRQTLLQLDTSKSKGPDGIPAIVLKTCAPELAPILNKLLQLSYTLGTFPTSWKLAFVFLIA